MVESTIKQAAKDTGVAIRYKNVTASRGKAVRAEPIAARSERGMIHFVGTFSALEDARFSLSVAIDAIPPLCLHSGRDNVSSVLGGKIVRW